MLYEPAFNLGIYVKEISKNKNKVSENFSAFTQKYQKWYPIELFKMLDGFKTM